MINGDITFNTWLLEWFEIYKKPYLKKQSLINIDVIIRLHIPDYIKETPLKDLSLYDLQKAVNGIASTHTREYAFNVYNDCLTQAVKLELIHKNPMNNVIKPKHIREVGQALNQQELIWFVDYQSHSSRCRNFFLFCLYTGCRRAEALSVCWNDIDVDNSTIHIRGTKTKQSNRFIPLFPEVIKLLGTYNIQELRKPIFKFTCDYVTREFKRICPEHRLHDLRHTFATRCLENDINIKVVQKWLGHTRLDTTANIYMHVQDNFIKSEATKFKLM